MDKAADIRRNWREAFGDTRRWMTEVFPRIYDDAEAVACVEGDTVVSSLLLRRYEMKWGDEIFPVGYIYGANTIRSRRGQGLMTGVMHDALRLAYDRGDAVVALRPARRRLFGFYAGFGFSTVFYIEQQRFTAKHRFQHDAEAWVVETHVTDVDELSAAYLRLVTGRGATILHNPDDFKNILIDAELDGNRVVIVRIADNQEIAAIAFAAKRDDSVVVREIVAANADAEAAALGAFAEMWPGKMTVVDAYPAEGSVIRPQARAMARIVNVRMMLEKVAAANPELAASFRIHDPIIAENNGDYVVKNGRVTIANEVSRKVDLNVGIEVLTSILFSTPRIGDIFQLPAHRPFMSLMLD